MRSLTDAEVETVRAAVAAGASFEQCAAVLADLDGCTWTAATLRYVAAHPAPVRVQSTAGADGSDGCSDPLPVLEGMIESGGSTPPAARAATREGEHGGPTHTPRSAT